MYEREQTVCVSAWFTAENKSLKKKPLMFPCDFGVMFVLLMIKTHQSPQIRGPSCERVVQKERESNKELIPMSLQCLLLAATQENTDFREAQIWSSNNEVCNRWVIRLPHSPSLHVQDREGENGTDGQTKEIKALQRWCAPGDQVILCVWRAPLLPAPWHKHFFVPSRIIQHLLLHTAAPCSCSWQRTLPSQRMQNG